MENLLFLGVPILKNIRVFLYSCMAISQTITELWSVQECLGEINQRDITQKLRKREQSFLSATCCLIHTPIKLHEDIPDGY